MNVFEVISFILYFLLMVGIGVYFFRKSKSGGEKDYFLGGRQMNGLVAAVSAGASDMSAWSLMGLPGAIYLGGMGQTWIAIGLFIGTVLAWIFVAPKLRRYVIKANDSITLPQFLANRFKKEGKSLKIVSAIIFVIAYCIYAASSVSACVTLAQQVFGISADYKAIIMIVVGLIIVAYTMLGGFNAVCYTDLIQGMLMLGALMLVPIVTLFVYNATGVSSTFVANTTVGDNYYSLFSGVPFSDIITGLGWGLGYFGMPHILVRYMSIKSEKEMKKSQIYGSVWTGLILAMTVVLALVARKYLGGAVEDNKSLVFITIVKEIFRHGGWALIGGVLLSAVVAASMSTADSQLLASSSALVSDFYKTAINKDANQKQITWMSRISIVFITVCAILIAIFGTSDIMSLVSAAWSIFGAAFGPAVLLSLYFRKFNYKGCVSGIVAGFAVSVLWLICFNAEYYGLNFLPESLIYNTGVYEIVPGFIVGIIVAFVVSLLTKQEDKEVIDLFDSVKNFEEN